MTKTGKTEQKAEEHKRKLWAEQTELWKQPTQDWADFLKTQLGVAEAKITASTVKICCPYHPDNNPSGTINTTGGFFKCFSCGKWVKDPIQLIQNIVQCAYTDAFDLFKRYFKIKGVDPARIREFDELEEKRKRIKALAECLHDHLCNVWVSQISPGTAQNARQWLQNRGIKDVSALHSLGLWPRRAELEKLLRQRRDLSDEDIGYIKQFTGPYATNAYTDSIVYVYAKSPEHVTAFKLRPPNSSKDDIRMLSVDDEPERGAFGVFDEGYKPYFASDKIKEFVVVEGEHDQLAAYQAQVTKAIFEPIFICVGGNGHQGLDFMYELGLKKALVVGDHDDAGDNFPADILKKTSKISCKIFDWPIHIQNPRGGKFDPDEAIRHYGYSKFLEHLTKEKNHIHSHRWCFDKVKTSLIHVNDDDVVTQEEEAVKYGQLLQNETELRSFAELVTQDYPLLPTANIVKAIYATDDSRIGFQTRIRKWLEKEFTPLTMNFHTGELLMYHIKTKREAPFKLMSLWSIKTTLRTFLPQGDIISWAENDIVLPSYFSEISTSSQASRAENDILSEVDRALGMISAKAKKDGVFSDGQGIHLKDVTDGKPGYVVTGDRVTKVIWNDDSPGIKDTIPLDSPADGDRIFNIDNNDEHLKNGWAKPLMEDPDFLKQKPELTLQECYEHAKNILNNVGEFKYQDVDVQFMAALPFYSYVHDIIFERKTVTHLVGEWGAGKSTILSLIANGQQYEPFSLTYSARTITSFTVAGLLQAIGGTRILLAIDEANDWDDGSELSNKVRNFYIRTRAVAVEGRATHVMGSADKKGDKYIFCSPIITAAATLQVDSMDSSRYQLVHLVKNHNKANARTTLNNLYPIEFYEKLRNSIFLNIMQYVKEIRRAYLNLQSMIERENAIIEQAGGNPLRIDRHAELMLPVAAVIHVITGQGVKFMFDFFKAREEETKEERKNSSGYELLQSILDTPCLDIETDARPHKRTVRHVLQDPARRHMISEAGSGVYFDEESKCIGLAWTQVRQAILNGNLGKVGKQSPKQLKTRMETCADICISEKEADKLGIVDRLKGREKMAGAGLFTIVSVASIINEAEEARQRLEAKEQAEREKEEQNSESDNLDFNDEEE